MAWRYRGPKGFVTEAKYNRYKHLDTYKRVSDAKWKQSPIAPPPPPPGPVLPDEWDDYEFLREEYTQYDPDFMEGDFEDQGEVETGVDYGEDD